MDYAIIGEYFSPKLLITEFDIQPTNQREIVETTRRKVVGKGKQSLTISVAGYLMADSFEDLEQELQQLQKALNKTELKLVLGSKPQHYYLVTWNSSSFPRTPNNGGYKLPISLEFTCLEDSSVKSLACDYGWISSLITITNTGDIAKVTDAIPYARSIFSRVTLPFDERTITVINYSGFVLYYGQSKLQLAYDDIIVFEQDVPSPNPQVTMGLVFEENRIAIYFDGSRYEINSEYRPLLQYRYIDGKIPFKQVESAYMVALPHDYIMNTIYKDMLPINFANLVRGDNIVTNNSTAKTPASVIITQGANSVYSDDFGVSVMNANDYVFNGITSDIKAEAYDVSYYEGRKTLLPFLNPGVNNYRLTNQIASVLAWHERYL